MVRLFDRTRTAERSNRGAEESSMDRIVSVSTMVPAMKATPSTMARLVSA